MYVLVKHTSELAILFLMLYTLQSRRTPGHSHRYGLGVWDMVSSIHGLLDD